MFNVITIPEDRAGVEEEIEMMNAKQRRLQPTIQLLRVALDDLQNHYDVLERDIAYARSSIAPIRKLPLEMLSNILEFCSYIDDDAPSTLLRVCRRWRVAASSPQVWSRIVVDLDDFYAEEKACAYLERSRTVLVDIEISRPGFRDDGFRAWDQLRQHAHRWRSLEITTETFIQVNHLLEGFFVQAPNLKRIEFNVGGIFFHERAAYFELPTLSLPKDFIKSPKFRELRLNTWTVPILTRSIEQKFNHVTTLHLKDKYATIFRSADRIRPHPICGNAIAGILRQCPRLVIFTLDARDSIPFHSGRICIDPTGLMRGEYSMPFLENISLVGHHLDVFAVLDRLTLPNLRTAYIEPLPQYAAGLAERFSGAWKDLIRRSKAPPLEDLHIFAMAPEDIVWTLERSPRMKKFRLEYCTNPDPIIKALSSSYAYKGRGRFNFEPRWVCSKISQIYLDECFRVSWLSVAKLIKNRHKAYLDDKKVALTAGLVINGHNVLEERDLDTLVCLKARQIKTLIEP